MRLWGNKHINDLPLGWSGDYASWEDAVKMTKGYDQLNILEKVKESLLKVKSGESVYERDSVLFNKKEYSWPLLAILQKLAIENKGILNLIDFGGSLGSTYFQNKEFLNYLSNMQWSIVEQKHFVEEGKKYFENDQLKFFYSIEDCILKTQSKVFLASSVIQYLPKPFDLLKEIVKLNFTYIIFDRTAFVESDRDIITVQRVPDEIYKASYPAWFFNWDKFLEFFGKEYMLIVDFDSAFDAPRILHKKRIYWKGIVFRKRDT